MELQNQPNYFECLKIKDENYFLKYWFLLFMIEIIITINPIFIYYNYSKLYLLLLEWITKSKKNNNSLIMFYKLPGYCLILSILSK